MNCPKCGALLPDDAKVCTNCGKPLNGEVLTSEGTSKEDWQTQNYTTNQIVNEEQNGFSITALILGLASIVCFFIIGLLSIVCSILAIIFGAIGRKKGSKGIGTAGMVIGIIVTILIVVMFIFTFILAASIVGSAIQSVN